MISIKAPEMNLRILLLDKRINARQMAGITATTTVRKASTTV